MGKLFGTNGIRGIFSEDLTLEFISDIISSIATHFKKGSILVGYDGRDSSPLIAKVVCSTLNYCGLDCKLAGLVPTPALEYATKALGYSGGIMITASHNPLQYSRKDELIIEDIYFNKKWIKNPKKFGKTQTESRVIRTYLDGIKSKINASKIKSKKLKVALDLGNGAQAVAAPNLCKELGCTVFLINEKIDGKFPGRGS
ncbi:MAG: phosphomannomutase [Candidatus Nitrosotenuis sp.]|nr:phosphomannomutase [Candidatus Nitrosotenuis sp.]